MEQKIKIDGFEYILEKDAIVFGLLTHTKDKFQFVMRPGCFFEELVNHLNIKVSKNKSNRVFGDDGSVIKAETNSEVPSFTSESSTLNLKEEENDD